MSGKLSIEKLNSMKKSMNFTNEDLVNKTGLKKSTIDKLFSGINTNPTIETLKQVANALGCGIDDFMDYVTEPVSPYYLDRKTGKLAQEIYDNRDLRILMDASRDLSPEDIKAIIDIAKRIKGTNNA